MTGVIGNLEPGNIPGVGDSLIPQGYGINNADLLPLPQLHLTVELDLLAPAAFRHCDATQQLVLGSNQGGILKKERGKRETLEGVFGDTKVRCVSLQDWMTETTYRLNITILQHCSKVNTKIKFGCLDKRTRRPTGRDALEVPHNLVSSLADD